jgi:hypothetical protein
MLSTCPPTVGSRRVSYDASWCPITAARCSAAAHHCSSQDARARSRAGCLVPPRPILSLLADDCRPYHHLTSAASSPCHCSAVPSLHGRDAGARSSTTMSHTAPLLPTSLLTPCAAHLASSSLAPRHVGTMRWHAHVCHVAASILTLVQLTSLPMAYKQRPSASPPRKVAAALCYAREHARSATTLSHHFSLSLAPCTGPSCPTQCAAIKGTSPVHVVRASGFTVHRSRST